jgi:hypothetical protein
MLTGIGFEPELVIEKKFSIWINGGKKMLNGSKLLYHG